MTTTYVLGGGCYWCLDAAYRALRGVVAVRSGFAGGDTPNPSYEAVCTGLTGHAEIVEVEFDETVLPPAVVLDAFFTMHDPRQLNRQGNDVGTQYRSAVFPVDDAQREAAERSLAAFQDRLSAAGYGTITTEIAQGKRFYYAEAEHQQYLHKNPDGYCPNHATGVRCGPRSS